MPGAETVSLLERLSQWLQALRGSVELSRALAKRLDLQVNVVTNVRGLRRRFEEIISHPHPG